ncbi:MAG: NAD-dependent epimerase/dehydratase family protein [Nitrospirae bacterium]|nr:NAD-dependent epimerase/dehydratase family protein [Nitrospirota bacterium]
MKTILITGGCGFVGRHLAARLSDEPENEIWIVDDLSTGMHPMSWEVPAVVFSKHQPHKNMLSFDFQGKQSKLVFINSDFTSFAYSELMRQPNFGIPHTPHFDEIYHLASVVGGRAIIEGDPLLVGIDLAIDSSFFLWAAKINKPGRILYASSSAAYPVFKQKAGAAVALAEDMINFEEGFLKPDFTYGWSKLTGEYLSKIAVEKYGLNVAVVRPFSGYGEDQDPTYPVPAIALRVANQNNPVRVWGSGNQGRDFVHIDDCVEACVLACRNIGDGSAVNIGSGVLTTFRQLAELMVDIEGYSATVEGVVGRPVGVDLRYCNTEHSFKKLQWKPAISLRDGMKRVLVTAKNRLAAGYKSFD